MRNEIIKKLRDTLSIKRSQMLDLYARSKLCGATACMTVRAWVKSGSSKLKDTMSIDVSMARRGVLFLSFGLVLLAVKQVSKHYIFGSLPVFGLIPPPPICFSVALRIILIVISLIFVLVILRVLRACKLASSLQRWLSGVTGLIIFLFILWLIPPVTVHFFICLGVIACVISAIFMIAAFCKRLAGKLNGCLGRHLGRYSYWMVFWLVYIVGWLKGLSNVPEGSFSFHLLYWLGFVWFFVIGIVFLQASWQVDKRE